MEGGLASGDIHRLPPDAFTIACSGLGLDGQIMVVTIAVLGAALLLGSRRPD
jgi:hypothetical protein